MDQRDTVSILKACELAGVSRRTIYNWIASGKLEWVRTAGGGVREVLSDPEFRPFFVADEVLAVVWLELWPAELTRQRDLTT